MHSISFGFNKLLLFSEMIPTKSIDTGTSDRSGPRPETPECQAGISTPVIATRLPVQVHPQPTSPTSSTASPISSSIFHLTCSRGQLIYAHSCRSTPTQWRWGFSNPKPRTNTSQVGRTISRRNSFNPADTLIFPRHNALLRRPIPSPIRRPNNLLDAQNHRLRQRNHHPHPPALR